MSYLFTIIIFPIVQLLELFFTLIYWLFKNAGISIIGISLFISVIILPFYFFTENIQKKERELQKMMKPKIDRIKASFKGDERYMLLSTYYRQNNYHPIYALRNSFNLLIQIPIFIAAYNFLSNLQLLKGMSFVFINDLGKPDALLNINNITFNILPVFMTIINVLSCVVYTKDKGNNEKYQLYTMSIIFLILLYNSPSALVMYWTMNNFFSLIKNIIQRNRYSKIIINILIILFVITMDIFLLLFHHGFLHNRIFAIIIFSSIILFLFNKEFLKLYNIKFLPKIKNNIPSYIYIISCIILFLLNGLVVPSLLISSSVTDFSFIDSYTTPFPFIIETILQSSGIFLFWLIIIYFIFSTKYRNIFTYIVVIITVLSLINVFTIKENFGSFTTTMLFSDPKPFLVIPFLYILNILILLILSSLLFFILYKNKYNIILSGQMIIFLSLFTLSIINIRQINSDFLIVKDKFINNNNFQSNITAEYTFSKTGYNILIILIDSSIGSHVSSIFEEKPELMESMYGFKYYPNCVSFANHTLIGVLPVFGGYEYTPFLINNRDNVTLIDKEKEAYLLMPRLFSEEGFSIVITDPPFDNFKLSNLSIYNDFPEYNVKNLIGKYTSDWLRDNKDIEIISVSELLKNNLIRFSFFKSAPLFLRLFLYNNGKWLKINNNLNDQLTITVIDNFAFLDYLDKITSFKEEGNTYTSIYSFLPHDYAMLQAPDYVPVNQVTNTGSSLFADDSTYNLTMASFLLLGKWFDYLKENDAYDNTRIIIVSDHGKGYIYNHTISRIQNGDSLYAYNPVLMFKDFNSFNVPQQHDDFMTNGDTVLFALDGIINNPINPFTNILLKPDKENGIILTTVQGRYTYSHGKYKYNINSNQWLFVNENIFDIDKWKIITK